MLLPTAALSAVDRNDNSPYEWDMTPPESQMSGTDRSVNARVRRHWFLSPVRDLDGAFVASAPTALAETVTSPNGTVALWTPFTNTSPSTTTKAVAVGGLSTAMT
jgi:hypothetical protein